MPLISDRFLDDGKPILELSEIQKRYIEIFREKCSNGDYKFRLCNCECGSDNFETLAQKDRYGLPMETVICKDCGLIMTNPRLDDDSNNKFYDCEYPFIYRAEETPSEEVFLEGKKSAKSIVSFIRKHTGVDSGSVLEIGCADGRNIAAFSECGYDACGLDLSHTYVEFGKSKGLNLQCMDAASFEKTGQKFDIIVLNHVLEHFTDIGRELEIIGKMMNPEGILFIAVPGVKALTFGVYESDFLRLLQNAHIYNFTRDSLCSVMGLYGFDCVFANEFIYSIFRYDGNIRPKQDLYENTIKYLTRLEKSRGDRRALLIGRTIDKISSYKKGEVLLYGTAHELDAIVGKLEDVTPIMGFFYSDSKSPEAIAEYIQTLVDKPKCLVIVDSEQDNGLTERMQNLLNRTETNVFSVYSEQF